MGAPYRVPSVVAGRRKLEDAENAASPTAPVYTALPPSRLEAGWCNLNAVFLLLLRPHGAKIISSVRGSIRQTGSAKLDRPISAELLVVNRRFLNSVSAFTGTLISTKPRVYLLKDRDPVGQSASRSVGFSKYKVLIGRTTSDTIYSIPDPTLSLNPVSCLTTP